METIIINFAVKWRKQVSLDCGSGSSRRLLSNSWICAPGEMSAGCWFPPLQQLWMNWLPQETRVGLWLVVPQAHGARKRKSQLLSHAGTWLKALGGQPGSLDQTLVISSRCFQTKQKNLIFFGFEDLLCFFRAEREPQRTFLCFPLQTVLLAADHLSCTQALQCIFSLCPRLPFLPTEETGCVSPSAIPGELFSRWWQISLWGTGTVHSAQHTFPPGLVLSVELVSGSSTPTELWGEPCCALGGQQALGVLFSAQHLLSLSHS